MAFIAGPLTIDSESFWPGGAHPDHEWTGTSLCIYPPAPLAGTPHISPNISIGPKGAALPLKMYSDLNQKGIPAPTPVGAPTQPLQVCSPLTRTIRKVVNTKIKFNGVFIAVSGDQSDTPSGQQRVLTDLTECPKIQLCTRVRY